MDFKQIDSLVTVLFMLLAIASAIVFFTFADDKSWFYLLGCTAIVIRIGQYATRFFYNRKLRKQRRKFLRNDE